MWSRKEVKAKGKASFKKTYWKAVLVALIIGIVGGGAGAGSGYVGGMNGFANSNSRTEKTIPVDMKDLDIDIDGVPHFDADDIKDFTDVKDLVIDNESSSVVINGVPVTSSDLKKIDGFDDLNDFLEDHGADPIDLKVDKSSAATASIAIAVIMIVVFAIAAFVAVISFLITIFVYNPIEFGCRRFFRKNLDEPAKLSNIFFAFKSNYKNTVKVGFFYTLFITLWSLLFVIPGIIKSYQYRLVPYLIGENPDMNWRQALDESTRLMKGNKWRAFVYDLSFLGWNILSLMTLGIFGLLYVDPYKNSSDAALYEAIRYGNQGNVDPQVQA